ncbi:MAG: GDP-mannose dehydrogenase [Robiginitomaculum sp.]|nr:MAG: GDP-mannose dehydrogenase [Robiginitomaculum sp.]
MRKLNILIFGMGYVGLTAAACALKDGHKVHGIDVNQAKIKQLNLGHCPIFEPGLEVLLQAGLAKNTFSVSVDTPDDLSDYDIALVCVGTPSLPSGAHNMSYIAQVAKDIGVALKQSPERTSPLVVVYRSTVRPGTMENLVSPILLDVLEGDASKFELVYNPEFLRESTAICDYFSPPKIVIGTCDGKPNAIMDALYENIDAKRFYVYFRESEITKFVDNSFHALKVTFANEVGRICHRMGISAKTVHEIFVSDRKLNISPYYLRPGGAFGGSCLPKDVRALVNISEGIGASTHLVDSLIRSNNDHKRFLFEEAIKNVELGSRVLMLGIAFKANSDDLRESPMVDIALLLQEAGFELQIYDPHVNPDTLHGANLGYTLSNLPSLGTLLVDEVEIRKHHYPLVIDSRGNFDDLSLTATKVYPIFRMS